MIILMARNRRRETPAPESKNKPRPVHTFFKTHIAAILLTALGLAINIAYILNSYLSHAPSFFRHFGGNQVDHVIIFFILLLLFGLGYLVDRNRASRETLKQVLERETYISNSLQSVFYPQIEGIDDYEFSSRYKSVLEEAELGGDFYDVFSPKEGSTVIVMADVIGKGLQAAIMGAFTKFFIRAYLGEHRGLSETVARISSAVNREYGADLFVTAFIGVLDEKTGVLRYVNAGHPGPLHVAMEGAVVILEAASMPLGIFPEQEFVEGEIVLNRGDFLVLYTDGLYECLCEAEATPETIAREVREMLPTDVETLVGRLLESAEGRSSGTLNDDVAVLAVRRDPGM